MTKLFGYLGAASALTLCSLAACTVSSTSDVSGVGSDAGKSETSTSSDSSSDAPVTTDGGDDGGSCKLAFSIGDKACDTCMASKCCDKVNACDTNAECKALNSCYQSCADADAGTGDAGTQCFNDCDTAHPTGGAPFDAIINCTQTNCSAQCPQ